MRHIFQLTAFVVLGLWLPTTVHCGLETAFGWAEEECCGDPTEKASTALQHCAVEDGDYRITGSSVVVAVPDLATWWCGGVEWVNPAIEAHTPPPGHSESPPGLTRTWQFVVRAAPPVRAPSTVS